MRLYLRVFCFVLEQRTNLSFFKSIAIRGLEYLNIVIACRGFFFPDALLYVLCLYTSQRPQSVHLSLLVCASSSSSSSGSRGSGTTELIEVLIFIVYFYVLNISCVESRECSLHVKVRACKSDCQGLHFFISFIQV